MAGKGLLFIPDISGFTAFLQRTEIDHSRLIIQELLETLIDANSLDLEISEIEGDAILFYKYCDPPDLREIYRQVEAMFCAFHRNVIAYDARRYCQCGACTAVSELTLKVVTHYGEFTGYKIRDFHRLIGEDVIVVHELLKNEIAQHEYWLITRSVGGGDPPTELAPWMRWMDGSKDTRLGTVPFRYTQLAKLRETLAPEPLPRPALERRAKVVSVTKMFDTEIIPLFHAAGDFQYRSRWLEGVKRVEGLDHLLPRVGMRCRCVMDRGEEVIRSHSYHFSPERIEFSEIDEARKTLTYYTLESVTESRTRLTLDCYIERNRAAEQIFRLLRKREMEGRLERSLERLVEVVREVRERLSQAAPAV